MARRVLKRTNGQTGFTLLEVVLAAAIIGIGVIATAPLFVIAAKENAVGGDLGLVGTLAVERMEHIRGQYYYDLDNGGSLDTNVDGYSDTSDPDFDVRWVIADKAGPPANLKVVVVEAIAHRELIGQPKRVRLAMVRGE